MRHDNNNTLIPYNPLCLLFSYHYRSHKTCPDGSVIDTSATCPTPASPNTDNPNTQTTPPPSGGDNGNNNPPSGGGDNSNNNGGNPSQSTGGGNDNSNSGSSTKK
jgi:hypothetical protein